MDETPLDDVLDDAVVRRVREALADRPDAIVTLGDPQGRLRWASAPGSEGMFGRTPPEVEGHNRWDYIHPDDVARARRGYARALEGETVRYTIRGRAADGSWVTVTSVAWAVSSPWGPAVLAITTAEGDEDDLAWPSTVQR